MRVVAYYQPNYAMFSSSTKIVGATSHQILVFLEEGWFTNPTSCQVEGKMACVLVSSNGLGVSVPTRNRTNC